MYMYICIYQKRGGKKSKCATDFKQILTKRIMAISYMAISFIQKRMAKKEKKKNIKAISYTVISFIQKRKKKLQHLS